MQTQARSRDHDDELPLEVRNARGKHRITRGRRTIEDLYRVPGKAELIDGEIVVMSPTGGIPGNASFEIAASLREHARRTGDGRAVPDNVGFRVNLPHRESFSPDAAFVVGAAPSMKFYDGAPVFAVEVRS
ncbi:MAG: Uma2 family endonuclease, partial [bacterium]|nr:Uma2 family endonuclease [bacterium]